jgi:nicotinate dehydrogenase subunit B
MNTSPPTDAGRSSQIDRRDFIRRLGGGVAVLFTTGYGFSALAEEPEMPPAAADVNAYLHIGADGRVTCFTGKIEMGQGIITSLAQMLADELDVPLESVDMVMGDTDRCPFDQGTWGSLTTRVFGPELRAAGAQARAILLDLAAQRLYTQADRLVVRAGVVHDPLTHREIPYGDLTKGQEITHTLERSAVEKAAKDFRVMGQSFTRRDAREKVTGRALYAGDISLPGMLCARVLRPPAHGAVLRQVDTTPAERIEGVRVVRDGDLVAVLHRHWDLADRALRLVDARYDVPEPTVDDETIYDHLLAVAPPGETAAEGGDLDAGIGLAASVAEETYLNAYVAHAPLETHTALAHFTEGRMTIWASTQNPFGLKREIAERLNLAQEQVRVITPFLGGGFGGKSSNGQAVQAARLALLAGAPVQVAWSREDEFFYDTFRPAAVVKIRSGIDDGGHLAFWDYHVYFAGERGSAHYYDIPHHRTTVYNRGWTARAGAHPFPTGAWRAPASNTNTFARECQMDVMAARAGTDPLEFRLAHLSDEKMQGVLRAAARRFGWTPAPPPSGRGFGVACGIYADTYVATMAEVSVDEMGRVAVKRVVCAQDMGLVVNPTGAEQQIEGCIIMGLGYALTEEIRFRGGEIRDLSFGTYAIPRFSDVPVIETVLIDSRDPAPHGGGEPPIITMGAVIANAIFDATGTRINRLPIKGN